MFGAADAKWCVRIGKRRRGDIRTILQSLLVGHGNSGQRGRPVVVELQWREWRNQCVMFRSASRQRIVRVGKWRRRLYRAVIGALLAGNRVSGIGGRPVHMDLCRIEWRSQRILRRAASSGRAMRGIA